MELLSIEFISLALLAVVAIPATRGLFRWLIFFSINVLFVWSFLYVPGRGATLYCIAGIISTGALCVTGYGFALWARAGSRLAVVTGIATLTIALLYLRNYAVLHYVLPEQWLSNLLATAGLSFLFFKMVHVIVDSSSGTILELSFPTYINYCLNFTTFLMGPIQRYPDFSRQWHGETPSLPAGFEVRLDAVIRVLRGLVKKFVLAELLRRFSIESGMDIEAYSSVQLLLRTYVFYLVLYCDFSGYCDIMIGIGSLMGVRPPENFNLPFISRNVSDYWLRVHKSLTLWLTDYVFNPCFAWLLRKPIMRGRTFLSLAIALMVTMFVSGLWHGTTLSFLLFGLTHGVLLVITRGYEHIMIKKMGRKRFGAWTEHLAVRLVAIFLTYHVTSLAYLFFVFDVDEVGRFMMRVLGS